MKSLRRLAASSVLIVSLSVSILAGDMQGPGKAPPPQPPNSVANVTDTQGTAPDAQSDDTMNELRFIIVSLLLSIF